MKNLWLVSFFAILFLPNESVLGQNTLTDIDGNVYETVIIGDQEWMAENLRTERYVNGELIPSSPASFASGVEGAWVAYDNDMQNNLLYGKLYNWHAVNDSRELCPAGWRVPTVDDWQELTSFLDPQAWGNNNIAGTELKSRRQVDSPLGNEFSTDEHPRWDAHAQRFGTDAHGFAALPSGVYNPQEGFMHKGNYGYFWSATPATEEFAWAQVLIYSNKGMSRSAYAKNTGFSVRCIKSEELTTYNLTLQVEPEGSGAVNGAGNFQAGQQTSISATPAEGYVFSAWKDEQGNIESTEPEYIFVMPAEDYTLKAVFETEPPFSITSFPWTENFEGDDFPPEGWQSYNLNGAFREWELSTVQNHTPSGAQSAFHNYGPAFDGMQEGWLVTPLMEIPENSNFELSFWSYNSWPAWYDNNSIWVSLGSGNPEDGEFVQIWTTSSVVSSWENTMVDLQDYAGQNIFIAFRYQGQDSHNWFLDDVSVGETGE